MLLLPQSLPEEERDRVLTEEKLGGSRLGMGAAGSPHRAKSPSSKVGLKKVQVCQALQSLGMLGSKASNVTYRVKGISQLWMLSFQLSRNIDSVSSWYNES